MSWKIEGLGTAQQLTRQALVSNWPLQHQRRLLPWAAPSEVMSWKIEGLGTAQQLTRQALVSNWLLQHQRRLLPWAAPREVRSWKIGGLGTAAAANSSGASFQWPRSTAVGERLLYISRTASDGMMSWLCHKNDPTGFLVIRGLGGV
jgi:hypothetical protein